MTHLAAAVAARGEQLKVANKQLEDLSRDHNETITRCNQLADKYNAVVKAPHEAHSPFQSAPVTDLKK